MSKIILAVVALAALGALYLSTSKVSVSAEEQFVSFVSDFRKSYFSKDEYAFRLNQFTLNLKEIEELNANPNDQAEYGVNFFADWTMSERIKLLGITVPFPEEEQRKTPYVDAPQRVRGDQEHDWR